MQDVAIALDDLVDTLGDADLGADKADDAPPHDDEAPNPSREWRAQFARFSLHHVPDDWRRTGAVVIYPGRGTLDFASARMSADLIEKLGLGVEVRPRERALVNGSAALGSSVEAKLEIISTVGGLSTRELRLAVRRIERARRGADVLACSFGVSPADGARTEAMRGDVRIEGFHVVTTFADLLSCVLRRVVPDVSHREAERASVALDTASIT